jgi:DNA-binding MarR family transcriptional regulator
MIQSSAILEVFRWGYVNIPGVLFAYARELDLDLEDIGVLASIIYAYENTKPLVYCGVEAGQVLQACSSLTRQKLSRKLTRLEQAGIISIDNNTKNFTDKVISLQPLLLKIEAMVIRDHPSLSSKDHRDKAKNKQIENLENMLDEYRGKIEQLELQLEDNHQKPQLMLPAVIKNDDQYRKVADFVARKTGNLLSVKMSGELRVWLDEMAFSPEFLLVLLELCFERKITNPTDISKIARDLKEYSINSLDGLEMYFKNYVDTGKNISLRARRFDPDIMEFGNYTGIDMNAEARRRVYYKWRYDWSFSHAMIMKAGELMCQRTKNGGLEYIDSVLNNWMSKEIRQVDEAEKEVKDFKDKNRAGKRNPTAIPSRNSAAGQEPVYEIFVPPVKK